MPFAGSDNFYEAALGAGLTGVKNRKGFRKATNRLFGSLGFGKPDRRAFRRSVRGGTLNEFFANRPGATKLFADIQGFDPSNVFGTKKEQRQQGRNIDLVNAFAKLGGFDPTAVRNTPEPDYTGGDQAPAESGGGQTQGGTGPITAAPYATGGSLEDLLAQFGGNLGPAGQALQQGAVGPSFEEMFNNLSTLAREQGDIEAARLNEAFGSRGARYGADILRGQSELRRGQTRDLAALANQLARDLRGDRTRELTAAGELESRAREGAYERLFKEYLIRSAPPPLFAPGANYTAGYGTGDTVSFFQ